MNHLLLVLNCAPTHTPVLEACYIEPEKSGVDEPPFWVAKCNICHKTVDVEVANRVLEYATEPQRYQFWKGFFQAMESNT